MSFTVGVSSILLTVTGFVVSLGLSFRNSSAYERYTEGRKYWAQLILTSQNLARVFWIHTKDRPETLEKDTLAKLSVAFSAPTSLNATQIIWADINTLL